jgi:thiosulfate dehydrogenase (quinone) large subunit
MMMALLRRSLLAPVWAVVRILVGVTWLSAAIEKLSAANVYIGGQAGTAVAGYLHGALAQTAGAHPQVTAEWAWLIRSLFLPTAGFWSFVVTFGELAVGIGLILGVFTGTALIAAMVMNMAYMLSGSATVNPVLFALEAIMLAVGPMVAVWGLDHLLCRDWKGYRLAFHPSGGTTGEHPPAHAA